MSDDIAKEGVCTESKEWSFRDKNLMTEPKQRLRMMSQESFEKLWKDRLVYFESLKRMLRIKRLERIYRLKAKNQWKLEEVYMYTREKINLVDKDPRRQKIVYRNKLLNLYKMSTTRILILNLEEDKSR